jgi:hypothetical protein
MVCSVRVIAILSAGALALACSRNADAVAGNTTVTHGFMGPEPAAAEPEPASWRLAHEVCKRRASCEQQGPGGSSAGATADPDCVAREREAAREVLASWDCSPAAERARLEECLSAVRTARCEPLLSESTDHLPTCRANVACGPAVAP